MSVSPSERLTGKEPAGTAGIGSNRSNRGPGALPTSFASKTCTSL
jgi:hypothetical protein